MAPRATTRAGALLEATAGAAKRKAPAAAAAPAPKRATAKAANGEIKKPPAAVAAAKAEEDAKAHAAKYWSEYYLMKNEPDDFSIDDLANAPLQTCHWEGVRNHQAKNILQAMEVGQQAFFYHSNCKEPGIVGIVEVVRAAYPDHFAFEEGHKYHDPKSTPDAPRWFMPDVKLVRKMKRKVLLHELKPHKNDVLHDMQLLTNTRLSIQQVTSTQWKFILGMEDEEIAESG